MKYLVIYLKSEWDIIDNQNSANTGPHPPDKLDLSPPNGANTSELMTMPPYGATVAGNVIMGLKGNDFLGIIDEYSITTDIEEIIGDYLNQYPNESFTIFFSVYVFNNDRTLRFISQFIKQFDRITVVAGGPFSNFLINNQLLDSIIIGDAETGIPEYFRKNANVIYSKSANIKRYLLDFSLINYSTEYQQGVISSIRGCKYRGPLHEGCVFCSMPERGLRVRNPEFVLKEMINQSEALNVDCFFDGSDSFVISKHWLVKFAEARRKLINNGLTTLENISIFAYVNPSDITDKEIVNLLYECGIRKVFLGLESADQTVLNKMNKPHASVESNIKALELLQNSDIEVRFGIVLGINETSTTLQNTYKFIQSLSHMKGLKLYSVVLSLVLVLPGSKLYNNVISTLQDIDNEKAKKVKLIDKRITLGEGIAKKEIDLISRLYIEKNNFISYHELLSWKQKMENELIRNDISIWLFGGYKSRVNEHIFDI